MQRLSSTGSIIVGLLLAMGIFSSAAGQFPDGERTSPVERQRRYDELARDVAALEKQAGILRRVVEIVRPAVVHIVAEKPKSNRATYSRRAPIEEAGSGVIIVMAEKFHVLTNRHLIKFSSPGEIAIKLADGRLIHPTKTWTDPETDIAVLAVSATDLFAARVGNSDKTKIGDFVLAMGSPFGLSHSVTYGIISAKGRRDLELATDGVNYQDFIQTDAAINPGNSGGPLVNLRGEVVGINTAIASHSGRNEGIGFSIPINMAMIVARQLVKNGRVQRAFLGVNLDSLFGPEMAKKIGLARPRGARISGITPKSPAERAELRIGDIILRFGNVWIEDDSHLVNQVSVTKVGHEVPLLIYRNGKAVEKKVTVGDRSEFKK